MAQRDHDWPGHTQWYSCPHCGRLWTYHGPEMVVLDGKLALAPASPTPGVPGRACLACAGDTTTGITNI